MFSEVRQAILPIALRNLKRRGDLERAGLLIEQEFTAQNNYRIACQ